MALGAYWMTKVIPGAKGEGKFFSSPNDAINAFDYDVIDFRAMVKVLATDTEKYKQFEGKVFETTVGRLLFNSVLPKDYPFVNAEMVQKRITSLIDDLIEKYGIENKKAHSAFADAYATYEVFKKLMNLK